MDISFIHRIRNPYGEKSISRASHALLATPTSSRPRRGFPAVLVVNGHSGSAWRMMHPRPPLHGYEWYDPIYWYGDCFARRGFVVLAVDISHRDDSPLYGPGHSDYDWWAPRPYTDVGPNGWDPSSPPYPGGDDPLHGNGPHPSIRPQEFTTSDWEEDGERVWDVMRALDFLLGLENVNCNRVIVTGLSMGGEIATIAGALDPRISIAIPASWSPDSGVFYHTNFAASPIHTCGNWVYADNREYIDISDYHCMIAPRLLIVQTGKRDDGYSRFFAPHFAGDKTVARRSRIAYNRNSDKFIHYLHYDGHAFHTGEEGSEQYIRIPEVDSPTSGGDVTWQTNDTIRNTRLTLFDYIATFHAA